MKPLYTELDNQDTVIHTSPTLVDPSLHLLTVYCQMSGLNSWGTSYNDLSCLPPGQWYQPLSPAIKYSMCTTSLLLLGLESYSDQKW